MHILNHYGVNRAEVYKRLYQVLYYGCRLGHSPGKSPTYVFPAEIRQELRNRFNDGAEGSRDAEFDARENCFRISLDHLRNAKWPAPPKTCRLCKPPRAKPY